MKDYFDDIREAAAEQLPWEKLEGKNILVTGATGLIGGCLVEVLMAREGGYHVYAAGATRSGPDSGFLITHQTEGFIF